MDLESGGESVCRICWEGASNDSPLGELLCGCKGSLSTVHDSCARRWFATRSTCEICRHPIVEGAPLAVAQLRRCDRMLRDRVLLAVIVVVTLVLVCWTVWSLITFG
jgi:E3 ubiquitin-protein ligase DOA10